MFHDWYSRSRFNEIRSYYSFWCIRKEWLRDTWWTPAVFHKRKGWVSAAKFCWDRTL